MSDVWLSQALVAAQPFQSQPIEDELINRLLDVVFEGNYVENGKRLALGAAFDLLVAVEYYRSVAHVGWLYCSQPEPLLFYPYTNACPRCVLTDRFEYHKANKPKSGSIGAATSRLLGLFIKALLHRKGVEIEIFRGGEPIDAIFVDRTTLPVTLFCTEIKASPLVTLPLVVPTQVMTVETDGAMDRLEHRATDFSMLLESEIFLFLPVLLSNSEVWGGELYSLGSKREVNDFNWAHRGLKKLLDHPVFFENYLTFWRAALTSYHQRNPHSTYWFTNGCGQPIPRPHAWPRRAGTGYESVSDGKTSVGMDRTDDIKKGTYQVLKLGTEGKPSQQYRYKTGIVSNIHAVRHFDEYLTPLKNIIWTHDESGAVKRASELPPDTELFNLFDGIVALTETLARDEWVQQVFEF